MPEDKKPVGVRFCVDTPVGLRHKFKMACLKQDESMLDVINRLMQMYVDTTSKPKGRKT